MATNEYITTVGLEIHAELKTKTKMFCNSKNDPDEDRPNVNICPVCMGHPGTLPVINKEAVKHVLKVGTALGGELADFTEFDRKNYFYPDIPKGYQISQYKYPLVKGGNLLGVAITRIHLEEDTAKSTHPVKSQGDNGASATGVFSLVDYNRAGIPLMELVTEPVIHSPEEASAFARELQLLLQYIGAGEANMEKGEMRVEANISVSKDKKTFGTKVEVKNLNSFKAVEKAIFYETKRHIEALENGEKIVQETRGWDEHKEETFSQRVKEDSHDYRYFPDPDLPKLYIRDIPEFNQVTLIKELPELPWERRQRYKLEYDLKDDDIDIYVRTPMWGIYFDMVLDVVSEIRNDKKLVRLTSNYITSDLIGMVKNNPTFWSKREIPPEEFGALIMMISENKLSSRGAKDVLKIMHEQGGLPDIIASSVGLLQQSDESQLKSIAEGIIAANPNVAAEYKAGKIASLQFFVGQGMKVTKGSANPEVLKNIFISLLV